jgi:hypothetical protein
VRRALLGSAAALALLARAEAYIEVLYPLQQFVVESDVIAEGVIEKADAKAKVCVVRIVKAIKGKPAAPEVRVNLGAGSEWHPDAVVRHAVAGAPVVVFLAGDRGELYLNRFFMQLSGGGGPPEKAWWNFTHVEIRCNRTFNGTAEDLVKLLRNVQAGKTKPPAPDPRIRAITAADLAALPAWGEPLDPEKLPASFARRDPSKPRPLRSPENPAGPLKEGLAYDYFEGTWKELPDFSALQPDGKGTAEAFDLSKLRRDARFTPLKGVVLSKKVREDEFALRFTGYLDVPREGLYTFTTHSDEGSKLFIGSEEVVSNDGLHGPVEMAGDIALKPGKHALSVLYFESKGAEQLDVFWEGPGLPRQKIPPSALSHAP